MRPSLLAVVLLLARPAISAEIRSWAPGEAAPPLLPPAATAVPPAIQAAMAPEASITGAAAGTAQLAAFAEALKAGQAAAEPASEQAALDRLFEDSVRAESGGPSDPVPEPPRRGWRSLLGRGKPAEERRRDELFRDLARAAVRGDRDFVRSRLHLLLEHAEHPLAPGLARRIIAVQASRDLDEALGAAIYLMNQSRSAAFARSLSEPAFGLLARVDATHAKPNASAAMLAMVIASSRDLSAAERERGLQEWRKAFARLEVLDGPNYASAAASNAFFSGDANLSAAALQAWDRLVTGLAARDRDEARKELLRVATGYESFGDRAEPLRSLAVARLKSLLGETIPPPRIVPPEERRMFLKLHFLQSEPVNLAYNISVADPADLRFVLREFLEERLKDAPRLQRHLIALDENGDGRVSLDESYRSLRAMGFGRVRSAVISLGSQVALVATTGRVGVFSFKVDGGSKGLHRTVDTGAMDQAQQLEAKLDELMAEDSGGKGYVDAADIGRYLDKRAAASDKNRIAVALVKAANKAEFAALFSLRAKLTRQDLRDFYTGSLFFELLSPEALARRIIDLRPPR